MTHIQLKTFKGQIFDYYLEVTTKTQLYYRVTTLMTQLAVIENINKANISLHLPQQKAV